MRKPAKDIQHLTLRLGNDVAQSVFAAASRRGLTVNQWLTAAVIGKLDRDQAHVTTPVRRPYLEGR